MNLLINLKKNPLSFFFLVVILSVGILYAQEQVGGPYTVDANTMLLMHFEDNLDNVSTLSANGEVHGNLTYGNNTVTVLGKCLQLDNDAAEDLSYVTVADTAALDLTGDWTIEGWFNMVSNDAAWNVTPRLAAKPGTSNWWQPNYYINLFASGILSGYNHDGTYTWPEVTAPDGSLTLGEWLHVTYMRDSAKCLQIQLIHNAAKELVYFNYQRHDPGNNLPHVNVNPLYIGFGGGGTDSYLNGSVDEIRVSNIVRDFTMPPILLDVTQLDNQPVTEDHYDISAEVYSSNMSTGTVILHYDVGDGFQELAMASVGDNVYSASISGQSPGTTVKYYVKAVDGNSLVGISPENAETDEVYYTFGVFAEKCMVLGLDFEEGSGIPTDASVYVNTVDTIGTPTYSTDAAVGSNSIYLDGSSYLKVDSPWLTSKELAVSFWFKGDELVQDVRLLHRPHPDYWYCQNYQIKICGDNKITAGSYVWNEGRWLSNELELGVTLSVDTWYRVIYEIRQAAAFDTCNYYAVFQLRDASDAVLETKYVTFDSDPVQAMNPLEIGYGGGLHFKGYIDDLKIYNYPALKLMEIPKETVGGPYIADEHTMLLLHFDGDLSNASQYSEDAVAHGQTYYIANNVSDLGQCLRIDNDSQTDSSYVTVADTPYVDLTGDWTLEGWINIFTFGESSSDWRWVPRLLMKPGAETFWLPNYFLEMWGDTRRYECGYNVQGQYLWPKVVSPDNTLVVGQWLHLAFIRDTSRNILILVTHNANRELVNFNVSSYDPITDNPPTVTSMPVHIGYGGGGGDSWLDGFVDEIRISDVVREFPIPPIIADVTALTNQTSDLNSYDIGANIYTLFSTTVQSAKLYYDAGSGFQSVDMTTISGDYRSASIPQQASGSVIKYYVKAVDTDGLSYTQPQNAETDEVYYTFGIYTPETQTLGLGFEEGSGIPQDASGYNHTVTVVGSPAYSADAAVGSKSIYLEGDSSYLEVDSPFLTAEEFCVDFWLKADSIRDYCRILNRPSEPGSWSTNNYQIRFDDAKHLQAISDGSVTLTADGTVETGKWYHVIYEVRKADAGDTCAYYAALDLRDENDGRLSLKIAAFDTPVMMSTAPLRIGKSAGGDYPPYFCGYFDDIKIYNYPAAELSSGISDEVKLPLKYELSQNYPNPFNPTTQIQFTIPENQTVTLTIYDVLGRKVRTLVNSEMTVGKYLKTWNGINDSGANVASGVYFYRLKTDNYIKVRKMILMR